MDQLGVVLGGSEDHLPETLMLINSLEWQGQVNECFITFTGENTVLPSQVKTLYYLHR